MPNLNITVSDDEYQLLLKEKLSLSAKLGKELSWKDFVILLSKKDEVE